MIKVFLLFGFLFFTNPLRANQVEIFNTTCYPSSRVTFKIHSKVSNPASIMAGFYIDEIEMGAPQLCHVIDSTEAFDDFLCEDQNIDSDYRLRVPKGLTEAPYAISIFYLNSLKKQEIGPCFNVDGNGML